MAKRCAKPHEQQAPCDHRLVPAERLRQPARHAPSAQPLPPEQAGLGANTATAPLAPDWWRSLGDNTLTALIERALAQQPSLKVAQARLQRAQAGQAAVDAAAGPQLGAGADATRQLYTANGLVPRPVGGSWRTPATAQFDASWEFDFFGRNAAALTAATGATRAAQADLAAARLVLASSVARGWAQLARLHEQQQIAQRALQQRTELLALTRQRVTAGVDTVLELRIAEGSLPDARQQVEQIAEQITLTRHALAALRAQAPQALDSLPLPTARLALTLPATVPADLLGRRADITAARWRIEAATGDVQSARANFYPNINLRAFAGLSSLGLDRLLRAGSEQAGAGAAIHLPIFDAGRLRATLRVRTADLDAAVESYNAAVIEAVREVADQLGSLASIARQQQEQALAQSSAEAAFDIATQRYRAGLATQLVVLNAESAVQAQRRLAAELRARMLDTQLVLIRSLGGGYADDSKVSGGYTDDTPRTPA